MTNKFLILGTVLALSSYSSAFMFSWGSTETRTPTPQYYYHKYVVPGSGPPYTVVGNEKQHIPSIPLQVPFPAQLAPLPNIQNVQLVPCLCPVSPEYTSNGNQAQPDSVYVNAIPVQHQQIQHQQLPEKK